MPTSSQLRIESLEPRRLLAGLWQASPNPLDVDESGIVVALDVLHIVNDINQNGVRALPTHKPEGYQGPLCDVNADGILGGLDVLLVVNAINAYPHTPTLSAKLDTASDLNGDQIVLGADVTYEGLATPQSVLKVARLQAGVSTDLAQTTVAADGHFEIALDLPAAINHLRFTVTDVRGQSVVSERIVRRGDVSLAWNAAFLEMVRENTNELSSGILVKPPPPMVAKQLAMLHGGILDAIQRAETAAWYWLAEQRPSVVAAAAAAAHRITTTLYPSSNARTLWDNTLWEVLSSVPEGATRTEGMAIGYQAAEAMLSARVNDGAENPANYTPGNATGDWRPTPPDFSDATLPHWPGVTPFSITRGDQFRPPPPPAITSPEYAAAVDEVLRLGSRDSDVRTADQTQIATFWEDGGGTATPPGHWNEIAADVSLDQELTLVRRAELFALLNYALADAGIVAWDAKYAYDLWRPIDAIRQAADDGNADTTADGNWTPLLNTPSFPAYTSGHSVFSGAAAAVLTGIFGDDFAFSTREDRGSHGQWPPSDDISALVVRSYDSFWDAAQEAGQSRIFGGIHFNFDNTAGLTSGAHVGQWVLAHPPSHALHPTPEGSRLPL